MTPPPTIRAIARDEGPLLKQLRLRALAESPASFGELLEEVAGRDDARWVKVAASFAAGDSRIALVAEADGRACGIVYGSFDDTHPAMARVGGMWVSPEARGQGIGGALLGAALAWARSKGRSEAGLWAPAHEPAALALYRRAGFRRTGVEKVHRPGMVIVEMELVGSGVTAAGDPG